MDATLTTTPLAAKFLRVGEVIEVGGFMRATLTEVIRSSTGVVLLTYRDNEGQMWPSVMVPWDQEVIVVDTVAEDALLEDLFRDAR